MTPAASADYPRTFSEFIKRFDSEEACLAYVEKIRWPNGFVCPHCGVIGDYWRMGSGLMRCTACRKRTVALVDSLPQWDVFVVALSAGLDEVAAVHAIDTVVDLGGPDGGRYWHVVSGERADDPNARSAAVHARLTGSVGCTYNGVKVERLTRKEEYGQIMPRHVDDVLPTGCYHCLERIAGRTRALCPSHGDEWTVG